MTGRSGITVIMPAFNAAPWIGSAIESVLLQSETSWELLIVDDGSSDGTRDIADRYAAMDGRVRRTSNSRTKGAAGSRNTGLAEARSEYVFFLDSDDVLLPDSLELLRGLVRGSGFDAARGEMSFYCHQRWLAGEPAENSGRSEIRASGYPASGFTLHLYRKDFLAASGIGFPEGLGIGEDRVFHWQVYSKPSQIPVVHAPV